MRTCAAPPPLRFRGAPEGTSERLSDPFDCGDSGAVLKASGPPENRINLVVLGDGYRAEELESVYPEHVNRFVAQMFSTQGEPYLRYQKFINVCRLDVASAQSGTDIPDEGVSVNTAFDGQGSDKTRLGLIDGKKVQLSLGAMLEGTRIDPDWVAVTLNVNRWFNSGGSIMVWSGARPGPPDVALHEAGHSYHALADEYGGHPGTPYQGADFTEVNVSISASGERWKNWLGFEQDGVGRIGAYEGGRYYDRGIYRPSKNSKMNIVPALHNAPCMEKIVRDIYRLVHPVDAHTPNDAPLENPCSVELTLVDANVLDVEWKIDGVVVASGEETRLDLSNVALAPGTHEISARVFDGTELVRGDRKNLEEVITWSAQIR